MLKLLALLPLVIVAFAQEYEEYDLEGLCGEVPECTPSCPKFDFDWLPKFDDFECFVPRPPCKPDVEIPKCPPPPPPPPRRPKLIEKECEAEDLEKCARSRDMNRRASDRMAREAESENARMAEKEALRARKANAEMANKNRKAKKASKARQLEEVMIHKLNDKTDVSSECEEEGFKKSRADILNTQRQACKAAERKAAKAKKARESSADLDADEKAMKAARRAARKKISFEKEPCDVPTRPCWDGPEYDGCDYPRPMPCRAVDYDDCL